MWQIFSHAPNPWTFRNKACSQMEPYRKAARSQCSPLHKHVLPSRVLSIVLKQHTDALAMMHPSNGLGEDLPDFQHLYLASTSQAFHLADVLLLGHRVRDDDLVQIARVNAFDRITGEDAVSYQRDNSRGAALFEQLGSAGDGVGCVGQIVDEDRGTIGDRAD